MLNETQRKTLLRIARDSIAKVLEKQRIDLARYDPDDDLLRPAGAFVTLTEMGSLRGCIGSILPVAPLYEAVSRSAVNAAFRDPRFNPLQPDELDHIRLEISVMGPILPVSAMEEVEVGRDGLIITCGAHAGLLLPQVAREHGWDLETFLAQTCVKAGLPPAAWHENDTRIERFSAEYFGD